MAKNLRQKYKEAKKKIAELRSANWRLMYPINPFPIESKNVSIRKVRSAKTIELYEVDNFETVVLQDLAFDMTRYLIENKMIEVKHTIDPFSGKVYIFAELDVVEK